MNDNSLPAGVCGRSKARRHMERAAELAPEYPENYLNLIEAYLKWNDLKEAKLGLKSLELYWPDAHTNLTGQAWAPEWVDWDRRRQKLLEKLLPSDKGD